MAEKLVRDTQETAKDPDSAVCRDPLEATPKKGKPLRVFSGALNLCPTLYKPEHPRLIDVWHPHDRFNAKTDCSRLRVMDAIVTILYNWDMRTLEGFCASSIDYLDTYKTVMWDRNTDKTERFNMLIGRWGSEVVLVLNEKVIEDNKVAVEKVEEYVRVKYNYQPIGEENPVPSTWSFQGMDFDEGGGSQLDDELREMGSEEWGRRLARYLLLRRPWETAKGVEISYSCLQKGKKDAYDFTHQPDRARVVYNSYKADPRIARVGTGLGLVKLDDEGYPSKADDKDRGGINTL